MYSKNLTNMTYDPNLPVDQQDIDDLDYDPVNGKQLEFDTNLEYDPEDFSGASDELGYAPDR